MLLESIRIPKTTGSYSDVLVATGVADLVHSLGHGTEAIVTIHDEGAAFLVQASPPIDTDEIRTLPISPGFPYLLLKPGDARSDDADSVFKYDEERAVELQLREATKTKSSKKAQSLINQQGVADDLIVAPTLAVYKIYNSMRTGSDTYNQLHYALRQIPQTALANLVADRLEQLATAPTPGPGTPAESPLTKAASTLQFWNPIGGKGVSRAKPDGTALGSLSDRLLDWFTEWMKFRGFGKTLLAYRTGDDFKIMVLSPADSPMDFLERVHAELLKLPMWGGVKLDIMALLTLSRRLVSWSPAAAEGVADFGFLRRPPNTVIRGFATAYFKSLGSATAVMNLSFMGLPGWFPVETREQATDWIDILEEYRVRLPRLQEDQSDHIPILLAFRDFLSSGDLGAALDFFGQYAALLTQQGERLNPFTARNLRRVLMSYEDQSPGLTEIIEDPGFKNVARAIRACTVEAQWFKGRNEVPRVEIRYGLAQDWRRAVDRRDEFVQKLADFVAGYNAEAARRIEKGDPATSMISAGDLASVVNLIQETSERAPGLVGRLLIAFGYATNWAPRAQANPSSTIPTDESPQDPPANEVSAA